MPLMRDLNIDSHKERTDTNHYLRYITYDMYSTFLEVSKLGLDKHKPPKRKDDH